MCTLPGPTRLNGKQAFATPEQLLARYEPIGVERAVLLPIVSPEVNEPQSSQEIVEVSRRYPDRFIPFCNVDPRAMSNASDAPLGHILDFYRIKVQARDPPANSFRDPMVEPLHTWSGSASR